MLRTFETTFWILSTFPTRAQGYHSEGQRGVFMGFGSFPFHSVFCTRLYYSLIALLEPSSFSAIRFAGKTGCTYALSLTVSSRSASVVECFASFTTRTTIWKDSGASRSRIPPSFCALDTGTTSSFACSGTFNSSCIIPMSTVTAIHKNMMTAYWTLYQSG
ncbi:hypothetical protein IWZ01DRAFT_172384 [Phyllosticta capitalensis]